jgi:hypothetical protein
VETIEIFISEPEIWNSKTEKTSGIIFKKEKNTRG